MLAALNMVQLQFRTSCATTFICDLTVSSSITWRPAGAGPRSLP